MLLTPTQTKPKSFESQSEPSPESKWNSFVYPGRMRLMFTCVLGRSVASTVLLVPRPFQELTASVNSQLREEKRCPFSGVTYSGRVWRKVPESDARSVSTTATPAEVLSTEASMSPHLVSGPRQQDWIKHWFFYDTLSPDMARAHMCEEQIPPNTVIGFTSKRWWHWKKSACVKRI